VYLEVLWHPHHPEYLEVLEFQVFLVFLDHQYYLLFLGQSFLVDL
jgi:hypothetical protein